MFISEFLNQHQQLLEENFKKKSTISASIPTVVDESSARSLKIMSFNELNLDVHKKMGRAAYVLKTDISQFYPSIYTHSIPWAIHSKNESKKDRASESKKCFFNELDLHLRNCQDGQTRGLFIGPDAARLISETILVDVDKRLNELGHKHIVGAVRYVDDYFIGTETEADASAVLSALSDALDEYELIPNDIKTKVVATSKPTDDVWPLQIIRSAQECFEAEAVSPSRIKELFDQALSISAEISSQSPIKVLLRQLDKYSKEAAPHFEFIEPYLLRFIHHFPHAIDYVCMIVGARILRQQGINTHDWKTVVTNEIGRFIRLGQHQEVAWLIWLAVVGSIDLEDRLLDMVFERENAHLSAMIISAVRSGDIPNKISPSFPSLFDMRSQDWLFLHEATLAGVTAQQIENDELELHKNLLGQGFSFVDFSLVYTQLGEGPVIDIIKFGYEDGEAINERAAAAFTVI